MAPITNDILEQLSLFEGLHPSTYAHLTRIGRVESYKSGAHLFLEKDLLHCFYIVLSGTVSMYKTNSNGQLKTIFIFGKDTLLNETIFDNMPVSISCKVHDDCTVLAFYRSDLLPLFQQDFRLTENFVNHLSKRIRRLYRQMKNSTSIIKMEKKLAAKLLKLSQDYGTPQDDGIMIDFPITITSLAELLGSYRETISRALKILVEKNLIVYEHKYIFVPDPNALSTFFKAP
ncbi:Crp/Fnr family transcriptional regulator [Niameybacter massiliensis]|uniref:Crp/Fnr family transcriptional regulator n=1 Tax=Niameybacter massiliensis TaxID=1658108 RepID=UPI0006B53C0D|nr:Crp/Fnr family transcriptional regulator [Niameybacter massiliensis]